MSAKVTDTRTENAPLLGPGSQPNPANYSADADAAVDRNVEADDEALLADLQKSESEPWTVWSITIYGVLVAFLLFFVGIVIKGFVDVGEKDPKEPDFDLGKALKSALGGGLSGAAAMVLQVLTLMPMRTIMNYQYRYGTTTVTAAKTLYADGGFGRYYAGLLAALFQGPISRFGDTAANAGILALLESNSIMKQLPKAIQTIFASAAAAAFRMILTPIDTVKTTLQTQGKPGWKILRTRIRVYGFGTLWYGALASAAATFVGHYPWFAMYNWLSVALPAAETLPQKLARQALIGFCASVTSDTISNSLRVVKTYRQVNATRIGYVQAARNVIAVDGWLGLFGRGLGTRIIANGLQGIMFSILWKLFMDL
ncbi:mitochondrial carrier [Athelia psychrophila]|uniref:Mitochondrial carrier n=1 Tax=Athelia psychrophila TaxID=1759441 RepID=A0A166P6N9_9AGAM|nr:mitochondrial carrier [Fibularhizoctonia sp. CBS 109695]